MSRESRLAAIRVLEEELRSPVIAYLTSTREGAEAHMGMDAVRFMYEHLRRLGEDLKSITLFLHSNGGEGTTPWKLVTLIREYCETFRVVVPHRAFSAATLTALGADEVLMHPMGMLGPTDPSITGPYNPRGPQNELLPIGVEEVLAYFALVKEDAGIQHEDELVQTVTKLADHVHPIALGTVKRSHQQSKMIAAKLMELSKPRMSEHEVREVVDNLTSKMYFHGHPINRAEAKSLGLRIRDCTKGEEVAMWSLYEEYERDMRLLEPFHAAKIFLAMNQDIKPGESRLVDLPEHTFVMIESRHRCDALTAKLQVFGIMDQQGGVQTKLMENRKGWEILHPPAGEAGDENLEIEADGPEN